MRAVRGSVALAAAWLSLAPAEAAQNWLFFPPPAPNPSPSLDRGNMPPDADIYYSTPKATDDDVDFHTTTRKTVADPTHEPPGTLTVSTRLRRLFLSLPGGEALEYKIAVGRQGFSWKGKAEIGRKAYWPGWTPPPEMLERDRSLPAHVDGGMGNPLGARALYLFEDHKDTLFRIHGPNEPRSIGKAVSSGCIRMLNADVIDLYGRVQKGTQVVVE